MVERSAVGGRLMGGGQLLEPGRGDKDGELALVHPQGTLGGDGAAIGSGPRTLAPLAGRHADRQRHATAAATAAGTAAATAGAVTGAVTGAIAWCDQLLWGRAHHAHQPMPPVAPPLEHLKPQEGGARHSLRQLEAQFIPPRLAVVGANLSTSQLD